MKISCETPMPNLRPKHIIRCLLQAPPNRTEAPSTNLKSGNLAGDMKTSAVLRRTSNFFAKVKKLRSIKFRTPTGARVIIWDLRASAELEYVFRQDPTLVLPIRGEILYFWPALLAAFRTSARGESFTVRYTIAVIRQVKPKLIITSSDMNLDFYRLRRNLTSDIPVFAIVQNSIRRGFAEGYVVPRAETGMGVDIAFLFSEAIGSGLYRAFIGSECEVVAFGSLKNSVFCETVAFRGGSTRRKYLCYVSDFRDPHNLAQREAFRDGQGRLVTHEMLNRFEPILLSYLKKFCKANGVGIIVATSRTSDSLEKAYFEKHLGDVLISCTRRTRWSSYEAMFNADVVVTIDSTLGYEAVALGKKTLFCSARASNFDLPALRCGWPLSFPKYGKFWMNEWDSNIFLKTMQDLLSTSSDDFRRDTQIQSGLVMSNLSESKLVRDKCFELEGSRSP